MLFTKIPQQYAPLGQELRYTLAGYDGGVVDIRMLDAATGALLYVKRFTGRHTEISFDAAPCIRRSVQFVPTSGKTGFRQGQGRTKSLVVEASADSGAESSSGSRVFLATTVPTAVPALLTSMPRQRIIAPGECDELTFLTAGLCTATVTAQTGDTTIGEYYRIEGAGVHIFRIDLRDFPEAETLTVDAGVCGTVVYTIDRAPQRGRRLAWRTDAGAIEHYTFPVEKSEQIEVAKKRAYGPCGHVATGVETEVSTLLRSAFETRAMLESLAELLRAPQVWLTNGDEYEPVDVVSGTAVPHRHDAVGTLEIEIRPIRKTRSPWN